jgi:hypothetical protein
MSIETISLTVTVLLAFFGYLVTYWNNLRIEKRKDQLNLINQKIAEFYGPLYILTETSKRAFEARRMLLESQGKNIDPKTDEEFAEWRIWLESVFMPLNLQIEELIKQKAFLIQEEKVPECMLDFITHVSGYKAGLQKCKDTPTSDVNSIRDYPKNLDTHVSKAYTDLKEIQLKLIGTSRVVK